MESKQVGFNVDEKIYNEVKSKFETRLFLSSLRDFIDNEYTLPDSSSTFSLEGDFAFRPIRLFPQQIQKLEELEKEFKINFPKLIPRNKGVKSVIFRHIIESFAEYLKSTNVRTEVGTTRFSIYFEPHILATLKTVIDSSQITFRLTEFLINDYQPDTDSLGPKKRVDKALFTEQFGVFLTDDQLTYVETIAKEFKVTKSAVLRDAAIKLIKLEKGSDFKGMTIEKNLELALQDYVNFFSKEKAENYLTEYLKLDKE